MDIREYMFRNSITGTQLARDLECSRTQIVALRAGKKVSKRFAKAVVDYSNGEVSLEEIAHNDIHEKGRVA